jgi:flagellum-specific ATP synthase
VRPEVLQDCCEQASDALRRLTGFRIVGTVTAVDGLAVEVAGLGCHIGIGDRIAIIESGPVPLEAEVVAVRGRHARLLAFGSTAGIRPGMGARAASRAHGNAGLAVCDGWKGRILDGLGRPLDGRGRLPLGRTRRAVRGRAPVSSSRARLGPRIELGVRAMDAFTPCRQGQRLGLFAGPGVGKSTLLGMLARQTQCETVVLALIGERGREVREFVEDEIGPHGLERATIVVATADEQPLLRREAAYTAVTIAEHFRDQGQSVLLLMDSLTRFCMSLREIALAAGEVPATRGYPASVFAELPFLLERVGPGAESSQQPAGYITGMFTILVEGNDHDEPVADAVRGMVDGHVILDRRIAEAGRYPAIDVLRSLSRTASGCTSAEEAELARTARGILATYGEIRDLVRLGAFKSGSDPGADAALAIAPRIEAVLRQAPKERSSIPETISLLQAALETPEHVQ